MTFRPRTQPLPDAVPPASGRTYVVGISGASGAAYALRCLELMLLGGHAVHLVVSEYGKRLLLEEAGVAQIRLPDLLPHLADAAIGPALADRLVCHPNKDVGAVIASGSFLHDGMVVLPCSSAEFGRDGERCGQQPAHAGGDGRAQRTATARRVSPREPR